jgi:hypothetical protein
MVWRIYRLPGSRENWHIDMGDGTPVINVRHWECLAASESIDIGGNNVPRAWIEIRGTDLHIVNEKAIFANFALLRIQEETENVLR